jgi:hypothetical protein
MALKFMIFIIAVVAFIVAALVILRLADALADRSLMNALTDTAGDKAPRFDLAMVEGLPEPAARFFRYTIAPGTSLRTTAKITMTGELSLGTKDAPNYRKMRAFQVLSPPQGFVWQVRLAGPVMVTGSDAFGAGKSWSRFRLLDLVPVGRVSGDADHLRSSFGRMVGEGLFWTPAAFLPSAGTGWDDIRWEAIDDNTAVVTVRTGALEHRTELTVDGTGQPTRVVFQRWSNENPEKTYRLQPFGGDLAAFQTFDGFRLPTQVTGGNFYGSDAYHPFFRAQVTEIAFR